MFNLSLESAALPIGICWVLFLITFPFTPYYTRKNECFGVSIPEAEHNNSVLSKARLTFAMIGVVFAILFGTISIFIANKDDISSLYVILGIMAVYFGIVFVTYLFLHKKVKSYKATQKWEFNYISTAEISHEKFTKIKPISSIWLLTYAVIIIFTVAVTFAFYDSLPNKIPMHFNINGEVDRYVTKGIWSVSFLLLIQIFMASLFAGIHFIISTAKKQISSENPEESLWRALTFRKLMQIYLLTLGNLMLLLFATIQMTVLGLMSPTLLGIWIIIFVIAIIVGVIYISFKIGQGGSRLKYNTSQKIETYVDEDDSHWKLGFIYYNPDDPAIFVEKRFGLGWTSNFARPASWLIIFGLFALLGAIMWASFTIAP